MKKYTVVKGLKVFGAPVLIHWSALLVMGGLLSLAINSPVSAFIAILSYFSVILLHEAGHAYFAHRLGYEVNAIYLGFFHGYCEIEQPDSLKHNAIIAWGGVIAQVVVAVPLVVAAQLFHINEIFGLGPVVAFLGYISLLIAFVNLAPSKDLDGGTAWKLIPLIMANGKTKKARNKFKVVK